LLLELEAQDRDIIAWITGQGIRNEKKELMEFSHHRFLLDIYRDESPKLVCDEEYPGGDFRQRPS